MGDEAHVRLVDAHAEGDGRHHDDALAREKRVLMRRALLAALSRVIGQRVEAEAAKIAREHVHLAAGIAINDSARSGVALHEIGELAQVRRAARERPARGFRGRRSAKTLPADVGTKAPRCRLAYAGRRWRSRPILAGFQGSAPARRADHIRAENHDPNKICNGPRRPRASATRVLRRRSSVPSRASPSGAT